MAWANLGHLVMNGDDLAETYRQLWSNLQVNRSKLPTPSKSAILDRSLASRQRQVTKEDAPVIYDMLSILDTMPPGDPLVEELFDDLLLDYVASKSIDSDNTTRGFEELIEALTEGCNQEDYKEYVLEQHAALQRAASKEPIRIEIQNVGPSVKEIMPTHEVENNSRINAFTTAREMMGLPPPNAAKQGKFLGGKRRLENSPSEQGAEQAPKAPEQPQDPRLQNIEPKLIEMIMNEMLHAVAEVDWDRIAGLEHAKAVIKEAVVWPMLRPDIFTGLRGPPKGILLFGPPGTGKTLIGKCIASQAKASFFSISASSLTSKWVGEGEKLVRALFAVARTVQPAVIFIDEIDSLLTQRTDGEFEASRRIKTEFLVQFDGAGTNSEDRILVIGATNRPQELDEAARRRLAKRLYIPLPDAPARVTLVTNLLHSQSHDLSETDMHWLCQRTDGYSGSDLENLCREAALGPIRSLTDILNVRNADLRPIMRQDFEDALTQVRASVSVSDLNGYLEWDARFGSQARSNK